MAEGSYTANCGEEKTPQSGNSEQERNGKSPPTSDNPEDPSSVQPSSQHDRDDATAEIHQSGEETNLPSGIGPYEVKTIATSSTSEDTVPKSEDNPVVGVNNLGNLEPAGNLELTHPKMGSWDGNNTGRAAQISSSPGMVAPTNSVLNEPRLESSQDLADPASSDRNHVTDVLPNRTHNQVALRNQETSHRPRPPSNSQPLRENSPSRGAVARSGHTSRPSIANQASGARRKQPKEKKCAPAGRDEAATTLVQGNRSDLPGSSHGNTSPIETLRNLRGRKSRTTGREKCGPAYDRARLARMQGRADQPGPRQESASSIPQKKPRKKSKKKHSQQGTTKLDIGQQEQQTSVQINQESNASTSQAETIEEVTHGGDAFAQPMQVVAQSSDANTQERIDSNGNAGPQRLSTVPHASGFFIANQGARGPCSERQPSTVTSDPVERRESSNTYMHFLQRLHTVRQVININVRNQTRRGSIEHPRVIELRESHGHVEEVYIQVTDFYNLPLPLQSQQRDHEYVREVPVPEEHEVRPDDAMLNKAF